MRATVVTSKKASKHHTLAKSIALGITALLVYKLVQQSVSLVLFVSFVFTISVGWAITSEFREQWSNRQFWAVLAALFLVHVGLMLLFVHYAPRPSILQVWAVAIPELLAFFFLLKFLCGTGDIGKS